LSAFGSASFRALPLDERFSLLEHIRPLPRKRFKRLVHDEEIGWEWRIARKSHIAAW
jgi:hypothetical protein